MIRRLVLAAVSIAALSGAAVAQDAAELVVRLNRLENQARQMAGQIEQLQYENRQLKEQTRKFQEDVEFRFQDSRAGSGSAGSRPAAAPAPSPSQTPSSLPPSSPRPQRRGDAFDPSLAPGAPGAPQPLGTAQPSAPMMNSGGMVAPRPQAGSGPTIGSIIEADDDEGPSPGGPPLDLQQLGRTASAAPPPAAAAPPIAAPAPSVAATGTGNARADYETAYAYLLQKQYEQAEMGLRQFLQSHPRDRLVPDATYWLGETYLQRNRPREAAEQFLKISTQHAASPKAPDAMLKLGVSLNALGARDQACATLAELERKYPQAGPNVRQGVEREQKRARCGA
jgi:tol-pal system protein YbgF